MRPAVSVAAGTVRHTVVNAASGGLTFAMVLVHQLVLPTFINSTTGIVHLVTHLVHRALRQEQQAARRVVHQMF